MKKTLLLGLFFSVSSLINAQEVVFSENFDNVPALVADGGWIVSNQSNPVGTASWFQGNPEVFPSHLGSTNSYAAANFNSTAGTGVISNWLISPVINLQNGDVISFWARTGTNSQFADNLELRISTLGADTQNPTGATGLGSFTTLAVTVNPDFPSAAGFPGVWTQFTFTYNGQAVASKIAFRYTVPVSAGPTGDNSNYIGVDTFRIERTMSAEDFFKSNFSMYPNPVKDVLNLASTQAIQAIEITDLNGRVVAVWNGNLTNVQMNTSNLVAGLYLVKVSSSEGVGTSKFVKK